MRRSCRRRVSWCLAHLTNLPKSSSGPLRRQDLAMLCKRERCFLLQGAGILRVKYQTTNLEHVNRSLKHTFTVDGGADHACVRTNVCFCLCWPSATKLNTILGTLLHSYCFYVEQEVTHLLRCQFSRLSTFLHWHWLPPWWTLHRWSLSWCWLWRCLWPLLRMFFPLPLCLRERIPAKLAVKIAFIIWNEAKSEC